MKEKQGFAIFDLDYTLLPYDTMFLFANFILKKERWRLFYLALVLIFLPARLLKLISTGKLKGVFLSFLWGISVKNLEKYAEEFVEKEVKPRLFREMIEEIQNHKKDKLLILNTAAPDFYAKPIGRMLGFDVVIATKFRTQEIMPLIQKLEGENNKGKVKIKNLEVILKENRLMETLPEKLKNSIGFSDSISDLPFLERMEKVKIINPDKKTEKEARRRGWEIIKLKQPYRSSLEKYFFITKQVLGFFP